LVFAYDGIAEEALAVLLAEADYGAGISVFFGDGEDASGHYFFLYADASDGGAIVDEYFWVLFVGFL